MSYDKILVIGASGSGKSTFAKKIAEKLNLTYVPTDPFYWDIDWQPVPDEIVQERVREVLKHPDWVMDGNFDNMRDEVWTSSDCILWLKIPFSTICYRVLTRNLRWWMTQEAIWSGNRMTLKHAFNGVRHSKKSYWKKKRDYPLWLTEIFDVDVFIFASNRQARRWLSLR